MLFCIKYTDRQTDGQRSGITSSRAPVGAKNVSFTRFALMATNTKSVVLGLLIWIYMTNLFR